MVVFEFDLLFFFLFNLDEENCILLQVPLRNQEIIKN